MATVNPKTRVSTYYKLGRDQTTLDFVDVPIGNDIPVFLDPSRLRSMDSTWASECTSLLQHFFENLLEHVRNNSQAAGLAMLEGLSERNEFHLGLSKGRSQGSGLGSVFALRFWMALTKSKAGSTGLLKDLEDACLFIEGVGPDRISDATCNIIRGPLIRYTQEMCHYYGIPMDKQVPSGPVWNPISGRWEDSLVELPTTKYGTLLLVPKIAVRHRFVYDSTKYYTHYLLPLMQEHEKSINSGLVHVLLDGRKRVTKKDLKEKYGVDKLVIADKTLQHPTGLDKYREDARRTSTPLSHVQLAEIENISNPRFDKLLSDLIKIPTGKTSATDYENAVEALLSALFFPSLSFPQKQTKIHEGRKRIDITYVNNSRDGFFRWLSSNYPAAHIFVECKNYGKEVENPEIDQLSGRFGPSRGQVGLLVCRSLENENLLSRRCIDTAHDHRGFIVHLTDEDLTTLVKDYSASNGGSDYPLLRRKFNALVL
ncbi:hypothetical protein GWK50_04435 [Acidovorax sp. 210-6]|uniref:hypothetical protein n=1 Tax=Acidovorax sp. 210-6 TaxID=2699468 RepID=UPI00138A049E|nr:hypothetical protein [Acidovorax sp. 210-6]NCU65102.1 hypothetical protein [Acidovorax sp. 210-6]